MNEAGESLKQAEKVSLWAIAVGYLCISMSSFGGGMSAWAQLVVVDQRKWLTDEEFLSALALCRILPGPNQVNLAVYVGSRLRGFAGVMAALAGMVAVPFIIVLCMWIAYFQFQFLAGVQSALRGMAAVAVGMTVGVGLKLSRRHTFTLPSAAVAAAAFVAIGVFRWPLIPVLAVLIPVSVGLSWRRTDESGPQAGGDNER